MYYRYREKSLFALAGRTEELIRGVFDDKFGMIASCISSIKKKGTVVILAQ